jgi:predicted enzyme related to lactoylglutathione lyase
MPNRVVHFEIEAQNVDRAKKFYTKAFGWKTQQIGDDYGDYVVVQTGENTGKMEDMGINGGIYRGKKKKEINAYRCVVGVENVKQAIKNVKAAGGKVLSKGANDIPNVGLFVSCEDTEGNRFTMLQPSPNMTPNK